MLRARGLRRTVGKTLGIDSRLLSELAKARMPGCAVTSELAKDGEKKTIFLDEAKFLGMYTTPLIDNLIFH